MRSISTDGVAVSVVMKIPHENPSTAENLSPKEAAERRLAAARTLLADERTLLVGVDPGRVNLMTGAHLEARRDPLDERPKHSSYTRSRWRTTTRHNFKREWEEKRRAIKVVKEAMDALSQSGGRRGASADSWRSYLAAFSKHKNALFAEFLENDERAVLKMEWFKGRKRAVSEAVSSALRHVPKGRGAGGSVVIGFGDASVASHGRGSGDHSVPVKEVKRALRASLKAHAVDRGHVVDVWEFRTTKVCYRCKNEMEVVYETGETGEELRDEWGKRKENRDFRRCRHCPCHEERPKLRNRDFNASINILVVLRAMLRGEPRPIHLCGAKARGASKPKERRRNS